jgi:hypothetical protein
MTPKEIDAWTVDFRRQMRRELGRLGGTAEDAAEALTILTHTTDPHRVLKEVRAAAERRGRAPLDVQLAAARALRQAYVGHFLRQGCPREVAESCAAVWLRLHADACERRGTSDNVGLARQLRRAAAE